MKKIFTLVLGCLASLASFAQSTTPPTDGTKFYITFDKMKVGVVAAPAEDGIATMQTTLKEEEEGSSRQIFTATMDDDGKYTFKTTEETPRTLVLSTSEFQFKVVTTVEEGLTSAFSIKVADDGSYAEIQGFEEGQNDNNIFMNMFGGATIGAKLGLWKDGDGGCQLHFTNVADYKFPSLDGLYPYTDQPFYIIFLANTKNMAVTAPDGEDGVLTWQEITEDAKPRQTFTAVKGEDGYWTLKTNEETPRLVIFTGDRFQVTSEEPAEDVKKTFNIKVSDSKEYSGIQGKGEDNDGGNNYMNLYQGAKMGAPMGLWGPNDANSKLKFVKESEIIIPEWNLPQEFDNTKETRYLIQGASNTKSSLFLTAQASGLVRLDSLVTERETMRSLEEASLIEAAGNDSTNTEGLKKRLAHQIWHVKVVNAEENLYSLINEAGETLVYNPAPDPAIELASGGDVFKMQSGGGGSLTKHFMAVKEIPEVEGLIKEFYIHKSTYGAECFGIGLPNASDDKNYLNAWGGVEFMHPFGLWKLNDANCAFKFVNVEDAGLSDEDLANYASPTTSVKQIEAQVAEVGNVYTVDGVVVKKNVKAENVAKNLAKGVYIFNGKKFVVK